MFNLPCHDVHDGGRADDRGVEEAVGTSAKRNAKDTQSRQQRIWRGGALKRCVACRLCMLKLSFEKV